MFGLEVYNTILSMELIRPPSTGRVKIKGNPQRQKAFLNKVRKRRLKNKVARKSRQINR